MTKLISLLQFYGVSVHLQQYHWPWWQILFHRSIRTWTLFQMMITQWDGLINLGKKKSFCLSHALSFSYSEAFNLGTSLLFSPTSTPAGKRTGSVALLYSSLHFLLKVTFWDLGYTDDTGDQGRGLHSQSKEWAFTTPKDVRFEWPMLLQRLMNIPKSQRKKAL